MDCNQVFAILTRGPFPTGGPEDELVEDHLETCGNCWRFAEALRPSEEVFREAIVDGESRDLPGYWGDARSARVVVAQLASTASQVAKGRGNRKFVGSMKSLPAAPFRQHLTIAALPAMALAAAITTLAIGVMFLLRG